MEEIVVKLIPPTARQAVKTLLRDASTRQLIQQQLAQLAEDTAAILPQVSPNLILCKLATFGATEEDTLRIYQACVGHLKRVDCDYGMLKTQGNQMQTKPPAIIASDVTVCLGFFREYAERRHQFHAAPSPQYYQKLAEACYIQTGFPSIADCFSEWLTFLRSNFTIESTQANY